MVNKISIAILLVLFLFGNTYSQNLNKIKLDSLFNILASKNLAMGSLTVSEKGKVIYSRSIGYSFFSKAKKKPATAGTKYRIGTVTDMFTASMIMQLADERKIKITDKLGNYFPNIPGANQISIEDLLKQQSGLHNFVNDTNYHSWKTYPKTQKEMLAIIAKGSFDFPPLAHSRNSNANFIILGYILEKVCNEPYSKILEERITSKIGLLNTYAGAKPDTGKNESFSYQYTGDWKQQSLTDMSVAGGSGCIVSTSGDLCKFIEALFSGKLVSKKSLDLMIRVGDHFGLGMQQKMFYKHQVFGLNGRIDGFETCLYYFPDASLAISYCANGEAYPVTDILDVALSACFNVDYAFPPFGDLAHSGNFDRYTGVYSSPTLPSKLIILKWNNTLRWHAQGEDYSFPLRESAKNTFTYDPMGLKFVFDTVAKQISITRPGEGVLLVTKDK